MGLREYTRNQIIKALNPQTKDDWDYIGLVALEEFKHPEIENPKPTLTIVK